MKRSLSVACILLFFTILKVEGQISGIVNVYRKIIAIDSAKGIMKLSDAGGLTGYIGRTAMIIQMKGANIQEPNTANFGDIASMTEAGSFEFGTICGQQSDTIIFENKLQNYYNPSRSVQLVILPKYSNVTITDTLRAASWNSSTGTGGVLAIESTDTVFLNSVMYADSAGFRGGALVNYSGNCSDNNIPPIMIYTCTEYYLDAASSSASNGYKHAGKKGESVSEYILNKEYAKGKQANGGGGGNNANHGGGGGANYGAGGTGGYKSTSPCVSQNPGLGGLSLFNYGYSTANFKVFLGGGGGAGHENNNVGTPGGNGGGIIYVKCRVLKTSGQKISANGGTPYQPGLYNGGTTAGGDGAGGGGGGGVVILNTQNVIGNLSIEVSGGKGSNSGGDLTATCTGTGGGGGGGVAWLAYNSQPSNITVSRLGGINGVAVNCGSSNNGATGGGAGAIFTSFAMPALRDSSPICKSILPQSLFLSFKGYEERSARKFIATLTDITSVSKLTLQRSLDGIQFTDVSSQLNNNKVVYNFSDDIYPSLVYYRVMAKRTNGSIQYSQVINFRSANQQPALTIFPNPAQQRLSFNINVRERQIVNASIVDQSGRVLTSVRMILTPLVDQYALPLTRLAKGSYQLILSGETFRITKRFTKL